MSVSSTTYLQLQSRYTDVQTNKQTQPQGVLRTTPAPDQVRRRRARLERQVVKGREQAVGQQELVIVIAINGKKPAGKTKLRWPAPLAANPVNGKHSQNTITSQLMLTSIAGRTNVDAETVPNNDVNYKTFVCTNDGPQEEANRQPQQQGRPVDSIPPTKNGNRATMHDACVDHGLQQTYTRQSSNLPSQHATARLELVL